MKKIYYEKVGRRYVPVAEYDNELLDSFPKGTHIVMCYPGGSSRRFNVDPNYAAMIAAGRVAEDAVSKKIMEATEIRRNYKNRNTPLTPGQRAAWDKLIEEFGEDARQLEWPSARECAEEAVKAMMAEAEVLMSNPGVKKAWDNFMLVCELTKENKNA
jgi:ribosomal protein S11